MRMKDIAITAEEYGIPLDEVAQRPELLKVLHHLNAATAVCQALDKYPTTIFWRPVCETMYDWREAIKPVP